MAQEFNAAVTFSRSGERPRIVRTRLPDGSPTGPTGRVNRTAQAVPPVWTQRGCPYRTTPIGGSGVSGGPSRSIRTVNPARGQSASASTKAAGSPDRKRRFPSIHEESDNWPKNSAITDARPHRVHCGLARNQDFWCSREHQEYFTKTGQTSGSDDREHSAEHKQCPAWL